MGVAVDKPANVNDLLEGHVALDLQFLDKVYLNAYVPNLQVSGQLVTFLCQHLGDPLPSPALFNKIGARFREAMPAFAEANNIPVVRFRKDEHKADVMRAYLEHANRPGVVAIGVAQEFQSVFAGLGTPPRPPRPSQLRLRQGRPPRHGKLLLYRRRRLRPVLYQNMHLFPVPGEAMAVTRRCS